MHQRPLEEFYLDDHHVDPLRAQISGPSGTCRLSPKAIEILLCLVARAPDLVTHEELLGTVWGDESAQHDKLIHAVSELRHALGDHAKHSRFIQTVPRRGYRMLVEPGFDEGAPHAVEQTAAPAEKVGFMDDLTRRGVVETGLAYLVLGWLLVQVVDVTSDPLSLPLWFGTFVTYLVIVGFPIALLLAWFIEWTPKGAVLDVHGSRRPMGRPLSKTYVSIIGALALASTGVFIYDRYVGLPVDDRALGGQPGGAAPIAVQSNSIAVLPFLNIGDTEEGRIFSEGLTEDVINRLARVPELHVSSRGDSFSLPLNSGSADVRRRLRVAYYLEGSIRLVGDTLRVVVQLIDSETGFHLVSRSFDRDREDFFAIQDEITSLTVANLRVALPAETRLINAAATDSASLDAYVLYRRGMDALYKPRTGSTLQAALDSFERALDVDPGYAAAHAGICMTNVAGYEFTNEPRYIGAAESSCAAALELNANLDVVHNALGELYAQTGAYEDAAAAFQRALAINPNAVNSLIGLGNAYLNQQQLDAAEEALRRAIGLQPGNWNAYNALGGFLFLNGRYEEAADEYREVVSLDSNNMAGWANLAASAMLSGDFEAGAQASQRSIEIEPTQEAYSNLGLLHYYLGDIDEAVASLEQAVEMAPNDYIAWSNLGDALSFSDMPDRAADAYLKAEELGAGRLQVNARDALTMSSLAWIKAMLGKYTEAEQLVSRAEDIAPGDPQVAYIDALILAIRAQRGAAVAKLQAAVSAGFPRAVIAAEPRLRDLRGDADFDALIADIPVRAGSPLSE